jgi:hypothetical protein
MNEIDIILKIAKISAIEDMRKESGFYLYKPSNQPERSKREDPSKLVTYPIPKEVKKYLGCGALNSMET